MGAGCDCNYFYGLMDDVRISDSYEFTLWEFTEGEGDSTEDSQGVLGMIHGAAWVMPDGTIIAQAMELENGEYYSDISANAGDTLLFFMEIPENAQFTILNMYSWDFEWEEDYYEELEYEIYISKDEIPSAGNTIMRLRIIITAVCLRYFEWPEEGTYWITLSSNYVLKILKLCVLGASASLLN